MLKSVLFFVLPFLFTLNSNADQETDYQNAFLQKTCGNLCREKTYLYKENDILSLAEQLVIQQYTAINRIEDLHIMLTGLKKLPSVKALVYSGGDSRKHKINNISQVLTLKSIISTSSRRDIAENFIKDELLIIRTFSARDITKYSVVNENEHILLPNTKLRVDNIAFDKFDFSETNVPQFRNIRIIRLSEIKR